MATLTLIPANRYVPAETHSTHPAPCATCGALWDEEEHLDTQVESFDGEFFCMVNPNGGASCLDLAKERSYRERAAQIVKDKIAEALDELHDLYKELPVDVDAFDHPSLILEDLQTRMEAFEKGKDSGWRNGVMLEDMEAFRLQRAFDNEVFDRSFYLTWELGVNPKQPELRINSFSAGLRAKELARIALASMNFTRYTQRTAKGEVA